MSVLLTLLIALLAIENGFCGDSYDFTQATLARISACPDSERKALLLSPIEMVDVDRKKYTKSHLLSEAVCRGDSFLVSIMLGYVDVNDPYSFAWGYRQLYTMAHFALDSSFHKGAAPLSSRLHIVQLLAEKGRADFSLIPKSILPGYDAPPLSSSWSSGGSMLNMKELRGYALLYGADPCKLSNLFRGLGGEDAKEYVFAAMMYKVLPSDQQVRAIPTDYVRDVIKRDAL